MACSFPGEPERLDLETIPGVSTGPRAIEPPSNAVNAAAGALLGRALPGFNFLLGAENSPRVILDALHNVTDVKVLSNPSLVVLDNQPATLAGRRSGAVLDRHRDRADRQQHRSSTPSTTRTPASSCACCRAPTPTATSCSISSRRSRNVAAGSAGIADADDLAAARQELDRGRQRPDRAARRPDQRDREQAAAGHSDPGFNSRRRRCVLASDQHARRAPN